MKDSTVNKKVSTNFAIDAEGVKLTLLVEENTASYFPTYRPPLHSAVHTHSWYELFYVVEGVLHIFTDREEYLVEAGSVFLVPPGEEHYTVIDETEGAVRYCFQFSVKIKKETPTSSALRRFLDTREVFPHAVDSACHTLIRVLAETVALEDAAAVGAHLLSLLLACASCVLGERRHTPDVLDDTESNRIYRIENICHSFFTEKSISLSLLAEELHLSERQVERLFKRQYGCNFHTYITHLRMQEALAMLKDGVAVSDVAESVGYSSVSVFYRAFRLYFGCSPRELLQKK